MSVSDGSPQHLADFLKIVEWIEKGDTASIVQHVNGLTLTEAREALISGAAWCYARGAAPE